MRVEVVAVGTELLLGQIVDTNSAWLGQRLAEAGVDSNFHQTVGDNRRRIVEALRQALSRSDAVVVCGGLGPTQDDITREALAELMEVELVRDDEIVSRIDSLFSSRGRAMPASNLRQAEVPLGARTIEQTRGTAPGLICPVAEGKTIYSVPGVPHEMKEMFERAILPDLRSKMEAAGEEGVIQSRIIRTWGASESAVAEALDDLIVGLDLRREDGSAPTIAFLASGIEGIKVRITTRAPSLLMAKASLDEEARMVVKTLQERLGDVVFSDDDQPMERTVAELLQRAGWTLGLAESLTGGLIGARLVNVPGSSHWFRGSIVAYDSEIKRNLLGVEPGPVVSREAAEEMAVGALSVLQSTVGLGITGVAGPETQDGAAVGTVFVGVATIEGHRVVQGLRLPGDRDRIRQYATISALDFLRRMLLGSPAV
ncbi:MAG: competence/damage-inducible protein A [Acidimicrobiales bacterium]